MSAHPNSHRSFAAGSLRVAWSAVRLPLLAVLVFLAPVVEFVCGGLLLLGILVSIAFKISGAGASFPFWHMIAASLGFSVFVILYHVVIALLSRGGDSPTY
jgi:hypothetical protein